MPTQVPNIIDALMASTDPVPTIITALIDALAVIVAFVAVAGVTSLLNQLFLRLLALVAGPRKANLIAIYLTLPGVIWHETSHALFAFVLGARITRYSLVPRPGERPGEMTLGCVEFVPRGPAPMRALQSAMSSIAPAITGLAGLAAMFFLVWPNLTEWWQFPLAAYGTACLLIHSDLSRQDIRTGVAALPVIAVILTVAFLFFPVTPAQAMAWLAPAREGAATEATAQQEQQQQQQQQADPAAQAGQPAPADPAQQQQQQVAPEPVPQVDPAQQQVAPVDPAAQQQAAPVDPAAQQQVAPVDPAAQQQAVPVDPMAAQQPAPVDPMAAQQVVAGNAVGSGSV